MTTFHAVTTSHRFRPAAGLTGAVIATMLLFSSGLTVLDHMDWIVRTTTSLRAGSFASQTHGDYSPSSSQRVAPQRAPAIMGQSGR